jgi:hypothetical protein
MAWALCRFFFIQNGCPLRYQFRLHGTIDANHCDHGLIRRADHAIVEHLTQENRKTDAGMFAVSSMAAGLFPDSHQGKAFHWNMPLWSFQGHCC